MTSYTVKKNASNVCQAIRIDNNGTTTMICNEGDIVPVGDKNYTVKKRSSDNKCCIYQIFEPTGGQPKPPLLIAEEGQIIKG